MKKKYRIGEVEEILGIPRSTIQYYIKKGILNIEQEENNSYYYFSLQDMREITHLIVGRSSLGLSLKDSNDRTRAKSLDDYRRIFYNQEQALTEKIQKERRSLEILVIFNRMLSRIERYQDHFVVKELAPLHIFNRSYVFNTQTSIIDVAYAASRFHYDDSDIVFDDLCSVIHDQDKYLVDEEDFQRKDYSEMSRRYVYTVIKTTSEMEHSVLLQPALNWAKENGYELESPFYLSYLFQLTDDGQKQYYYEIYLPLRSQ